MEPLSMIRAWKFSCKTMLEEESPRIFYINLVVLGNATSAENLAILHVNAGAKESVFLISHSDDRRGRSRSRSKDRKKKKSHSHRRRSESS